MASRQEGPFFNLKAVVKQTGIKPDTLRAWERRYGLPQPKRSSGGHRLYSRHDIDTIKWLTARQREGLNIKRAVELWIQIKEDGRNPLKSATPIATPAPAAPIVRAPGGTVSEMRDEWIDACLAYDEQRAEQTMAQAFALYPPETVAVEILQRAVAEIGEGWYQGDVTVQQEHFCSALAVRRLEAMLMAAPPPTRPGRILIACPPRENHVIGPLLLALLLRRRGWGVVNLGANVPSERLETTLVATRPQLAILAAQQLHSAASLVQAAQVLEQEEVPLAYGGLIFNLLPGLRDRIPGHFLGERLDMAPRMVEALITAPQPTPEIQPVPDAYQQALDHYRDRLGLLEANLTAGLQARDMPTGHLAMANRQLELNIRAGLALGDLDYLGTNLEWVAGLLENQQIPSDQLVHYLAAYRQAARAQLDERGAPIVDWLDRVLNNHRPE